MEAGKELDKEIATRLLKAVVVSRDDDYFMVAGDKSLTSLPKFSLDTNACYEVVHHLKKREHMVNMGYNIDDGKVYWKTTITKGKSNYESGRWCETLAESICLAVYNMLERNKTKSAEKPQNVIAFPFKPKE